jgi:ABC-type nitrate/sulfonate/bicarbonate transport system substrate-binding protein
MATADLKLVYGSGGGFTPSFFSGRLQIATASSGTLVTITAPAGKRVRLTGLITNPTATESGITVIADGNPVVSGLTLTNGFVAAVGSFTVGNNFNNSPGQGSGNIDYIQGNNTIVIQKDAGSTATAIAYSYAYGE